MRLQDYLDRIRFEGGVGVNVTTLRNVHRQHLLHIPYENLSVQLAEPVGLAIEPIYRKIVERGRGGWCYEMNGLLQWSLEQIGFDVLRMSAGVMRSERGDEVIGNHLVLAVHVDDETWLADAGFGDGLREPIPLQEGPFRQGHLTYSLQRLDDGYWRFHNHEFGGAPNFDFRYEKADETLLKAHCDWQQTEKESSFVLNLICQKFEPEALQVLRGRVRRTVAAHGVREWVLENAEDLESELRSVFGLEVNVDQIWPAIAARHEELFGNERNFVRRTPSSNTGSPWGSAGPSRAPQAESSGR